MAFPGSRRIPIYSVAVRYVHIFPPHIVVYAWSGWYTGGHRLSTLFVMPCRASGSAAKPCRSCGRTRNFLAPSPLAVGLSGVPNAGLCSARPITRPAQPRGSFKQRDVQDADTHASLASTRSARSSLAVACCVW